MAEENTSKKVKKVDELLNKREGKIRRISESKEKEDFAQQLATRAKLERDYKEDHIHVSFNSSPETRRTILARRPTKKEFIDILNLSIQATKYGSVEDPESLDKLSEIYSGIHKMAAKLCVDKSLNEDFWENKVSFVTLQNFIGELINASQQLGAGGITETEFKKFRGK